MRIGACRRYGRAAAWLLLAWSAAAAAAAATPAPSGAGWEAVDAQLQAAVAPPGYLGVVAVVAHEGETRYRRAFGTLDLARSRPIAPDAIFRLYSMTKPVVSVAALMLVEDGRLDLDAPAARWVPELGALRVLGADGRLRAPARPVTVRHLLTHTAGFAVAEGPALRARERADPHGAGDLAGYVHRLAQAPLAHDPGSVFEYDGAATETLSRVLEVAAGMPLAELLRTRVTGPLGMRDTGFSVPEAERGRVVDLTTLGDDGTLRLADGPRAREPGAPLNRYDSGAGGLYGTADDYLRLCRMLLDGGVLDGRRHLREDSVRAMLSDQLGGLARPHTQFSEHEGFGLGVAVQRDPAARGRLGSPGQVGWSGAASTYFMIDPQRRLIAILLAQHLPRDVPGDLPRLSLPFYNLVQQRVSP
ncbi:beta-lactamase family protein [Luteimonas sp. Y-2-2-4F]|nr:serine hydrolase domain-containing protein [Luteimonas sp. Y-2-2-4F]MCD9031887.1 beta-lactamase family protein [Luteimonas sp. Y-2-2-4F]